MQIKKLTLKERRFIKLLMIETGCSLDEAKFAVRSWLFINTMEKMHFERKLNEVNQLLNQAE